MLLDCGLYFGRENGFFVSGLKIRYEIVVYI